MNRPAWIFHLGNFANTQNLIQHLVELIARKLMSVPTLKQQAEVINRVWTQLERLIKSYHITMLASKFPPKVSPPTCAKLGCVFSMVIWTVFRMGQCRDGDH